MAISAPTGSARRPMAADQDRAARMRALLRTLRPEGLDAETEDATSGAKLPMNGSAPSGEMTPGGSRVAATLMGNPGPKGPTEPTKPTLTAGLKMPAGPGPYGSDEEGSAGPEEDMPPDAESGGDEDAAASARMRRRMRRRGTVA